MLKLLGLVCCIGGILFFGAIAEHIDIFGDYEEDGWDGDEATD